MVDNLFFYSPFLLTLTLSRWPLSYLFLSSFSQSCPKLAPSIPRFQLFRSNFCSAAGPTYHSANIFLVFCVYVFLYFCIFVFLYFCFQLFRPNFCSAASPTNHSANPNSLSTHGNIPLELGKWKAWKSFVEKNIIYISMTSAFFSFATIILSRVNYTDDLVSISIFWISPYQQDENLVKLSWRPR